MNKSVWQIKKNIYKNTFLYLVFESSHQKSAPPDSVTDLNGFLIEMIHHYKTSTFEAREYFKALLIAV